MLPSVICLFVVASVLRCQARGKAAGEDCLTRPQVGPDRLAHYMRNPGKPGLRGAPAASAVCPAHGEIGNRPVLMSSCPAGVATAREPVVKPGPPCPDRPAGESRSGRRYRDRSAAWP